MIGLGILILFLSSEQAWGEKKFSPDQLDQMDAQMSCSNGNAKGCYNLGVHYYNQKKLSKAQEPFRMSCDEGFCRSCLQLAKIQRYYAEEAPSSENKPHWQEAYVWAKVAKQRNCTRADELMKKAYAHLGDQERALAEKKVRLLLK